MKASTSVAAAAIALMLASLMVLAGEAIQLVGAVHILRGRGEPLSAFMSARPGVLLVLPIAFSLLGLVAAVGVLELREWGRRATLFLATIPVAIYSLLVVLRPVSIFPARMSGNLFAVGDLGLPVCIYALAVFAPLSLWWLILLTRSGIRSQFR